MCAIGAPRWMRAWPLQQHALRAALAPPLRVSPRPFSMKAGGYRRNRAARIADTPGVARWAPRSSAYTRGCWLRCVSLALRKMLAAWRRMQRAGKYHRTSLRAAKTAARFDTRGQDKGRPCKTGPLRNSGHWCVPPRAMLRVSARRKAVRRALVSTRENLALVHGPLHIQHHCLRFRQMGF